MEIRLGFVCDLLACKLVHMEGADASIMWPSCWTGQKKMCRGFSNNIFVFANVNIWSINETDILTYVVFKVNIISVDRGTLKLIRVAYLHFSMSYGAIFWGTYSCEAFNMKENHQNNEKN
jgi:hypothetical protein